VSVEIVPADVYVTGSISETNRVAIQYVITNYVYPYTTVPLDSSQLVTQANIASGTIPAGPRIRVNRAASLTLSTTFQRIDFNGTDAINVNTYPTNASSQKFVDWDSTNKKFLFRTTVDRNYIASIYLTTTNTSLLNTVNLTSASLQMRFVVPNGVSAGVDYYFPDPLNRGLIDLSLVNSVSPWTQNYLDVVYANSLIQANGLAVDIRLSNTILGTTTLTAAAMLVYST
jgi:hypothetical protein